MKGDQDLVYVSRPSKVALRSPRSCFGMPVEAKFNQRFDFRFFFRIILEEIGHGRAWLGPLRSAR